MTLDRKSCLNKNDLQLIKEIIQRGLTTLRISILYRCTKCLYYFFFNRLAAAHNFLVTSFPNVAIVSQSSLAITEPPVLLAYVLGSAILCCKLFLKLVHHVRVSLITFKCSIASVSGLIRLFNVN